MCSFSELQEASVNDGSNLHPYSGLVKKFVTNQKCFIWKGILDLEIRILTFVQSQREGSFQLYRQVLRKVIWWYFSLDHFYYARWRSVHIFDMMVLEIVHKDVFKNFHLGQFCFQKTNRVFSMMSLDQLHEQNNRAIKSSVAINFANRTDDLALIRWDTCGEEISRIINEFEDTFRP